MTAQLRLGVCLLVLALALAACGIKGDPVAPGNAEQPKRLGLP